MIHVVKLCVGISTLEELESYRNERAHWWGADYGETVHVHRTRSMPRRRDEIEGTASIYWVIGGMIRCRQRILELREAVDSEGLGCCDILMDRDLIRTQLRPKSPFQGWRYLKPEDAPPDLGAPGFAEEGGAPELAEELAKLGLL